MEIRIHTVNIGNLKRCLSDFIATFGLQAPFISKSAEQMFASGLYGPCIREIKRHFGIESTLRIWHVRDSNKEIWFHPECRTTSLLIGRHFDAKREPAIVSAPNSLRLFGTKAFEASTLELHLHPAAKNVSYEQFALIIGHQMAHILLHATYHRLRRSEVATDLLAMVMGFHVIAHRAVSDPAQKFGYLNYYESSFAYHFIAKRLKSKPILMPLGKAKQYL